jgi:hypothetical protein
LEALRAFHFDVAAVDLAGGEDAWLDHALDVASVAFLLRRDDDLAPLHKAGIRWRLHIVRLVDGELEWSLATLHI